jgi:DNA-directed RNA polymerase sigma subunit (sigma70/sigma32)
MFNSPGGNMYNALMLSEEQEVDTLMSSVREGELPENGDRQDEEMPEKETAPKGPSLNSIALYLKEISKTPRLTFEEEQELGKRITAGDQDARAKMIEANLRLVVAIGKHYINRGYSLKILSRKATSA